MKPFRRHNRPVSLTVLAWIYIAIGTVGLLYHLNELRLGQESMNEGVWIELTELLAIVSGVFILRGQNWARWLTLA